MRAIRVVIEWEPMATTFRLSECDPALTETDRTERFGPLGLKHDALPRAEHTRQVDRARHAARSPRSWADLSRQFLAGSHQGGSLHKTDATDLGIQNAILTGRIGAERQGNAANHCHIGQHRPRPDRPKRPQAESRIPLRLLEARPEVAAIVRGERGAWCRCST